MTLFRKQRTRQSSGAGGLEHLNSKCGVHVSDAPEQFGFLCNGGVHGGTEGASRPSVRIPPRLPHGVRAHLGGPGRNHRFSGGGQSDELM